MLKRVIGIIFLAALAASVNAQQMYSDPEGHYNLRVPTGWELKKQPNGVSLLKGEAYVSVLVMRGQGTPRSLVEFFAGKIGSQWKKFDGASAGDLQVGGRTGAYGWYTGINPKGVEAVMKVVTATGDEKGYAMLMSSPRSNFSSVKNDFERIESSFELFNPSK